MGYLFCFLAFAFIGSYLVPLRFSRAKGDAFLGHMGFGLLACLLFLLPSLRELASQPRWLVAALFSGALWALAQALANRALGEISFAKAVAVYNLNTFVNMAAGLLLFHEAATPRAALILVFGGTVLFLGAWLVSSAQASPEHEGNLGKGLALAAGAGLLWGLYFIPIQFVKRQFPVPGFGEFHMLAGLLAGGGVTAVLIGSLNTRGMKGSRRDLLASTATAVLWTVGTSFFLLAIRELGLARAVPLINTNTLMYAGWSLFVFRELPLSQAGRVLSGALLVVVGAGFFALA